MPYDRTGPLKPIKWYKDLATKKGRFEAGALLVEGSRAIRQIVSSSPHELLEILSTQPLPAIYRKYAQRLITGSQLHSICSTKTPQEIAAVVRLPADTYSDRLPGKPGAKILLLEDVQDPGNVRLYTAAKDKFSIEFERREETGEGKAKKVQTRWEVLATAKREPAPAAWQELRIAWKGKDLKLSLGGKEVLTAALPEPFIPPMGRGREIQDNQLGTRPPTMTFGPVSGAVMDDLVTAHQPGAI